MHNKLHFDISFAHF